MSNPNVRGPMIPLQALVEAVDRLEAKLTAPPSLRGTCGCGHKRQNAGEVWITYEEWNDYTAPWANRFSVCSRACLHRRLPTGGEA